VTFLDPGAGTGTYLLTLINEAARAAASGGPGLVGPAVDDLLTRSFGFEYLIGPYTVAHLRLGAGAAQHGASTAATIRLYLTDTLQEPGAPVRPTMLYLSKPLADEHNEADRVKTAQPILVILGNPPYGRGRRLPGSWIDGLMADYRSGVAPEHQKNLEDSYVRFLRWATWRLTETQTGPAILTFITNKSYVAGTAFQTLRARLRREFEHIYVLNLNGDSKRALFPGDTNVFDVQVGVAILIAVRTVRPSAPAQVWYDSWTGPGANKLARLASERVASVRWQPVTRPDPGDPFVPAGSAVFADWPSLDDCFADNFSGIETTRDGFVIAGTQSLLKDKMDAFYALAPGTDERRALFRESRDSKESDVRSTAYSASLVKPIAFRPYDREYLYDDPAFVTWPRPELRGAWGSSNVALATVTPLVSGPAVVVVGEIPSRHVYLDGARIYPRDDSRGVASSLFGGSNVRTELLDLLSAHYGRKVTPHEAFHYIVAALSSPKYTDQFADSLEFERARVPFPDDLLVFERGALLGEAIATNEMQGTPYPGGTALQVVGSGGSIGDVHWDSGALWLNDNVSVRGVTADEWQYTISRYPVLPRWHEARRTVLLTLPVLNSILDLVWTIRQALTLEVDADALAVTVVGGKTIVGTSIARGKVKRALFGGVRPKSLRSKPVSLKPKRRTTPKKSRKTAGGKT
jgi:predicted helicase